MYGSNLKLRWKVLDRYIWVIRKIGDLWPWECFLKNRFLDKKTTVYSIINEKYKYSNYVSGIENEEVRMLELDEVPSPPHEFRNNCVSWKLNYENQSSS